MNRIDGRKASEMRRVKITPDYIIHPEGSVLIEMGKTKVICNATVEEKVPPFLAGKGLGWVTAEYSMLPRATNSRSSRDISKLKLNGRSAEIQRLIGRSLRACMDLSELGPYSITIDCDVLQGDGGTRMASVTGGFVALALALKKMKTYGMIDRLPHIQSVSGVSAGIVEGQAMLDLCYEEDSSAEVDFNCVMTENGGLVEIQGTGEGRPYTAQELQELLTLCAKGCSALSAKQHAAIGEWK